MNGEEKSEKGSARLDQLREQAGQIAGKAKEGLNRLNESTAAYQEGARELLDSVGLYIKENPQRAAVIAILSGIGLGFLFGRITKRGRD
ncbi:MAG: hypothetical protein JNM27_04035 [Leptospirales bacterium]|nr:hypothetical protein [Leptospirales bacterium]